MSGRSIALFSLIVAGIALSWNIFRDCIDKPKLTLDRAGLERLIRYCARPIFSSERLDLIATSFLSPLPMGKQPSCSNHRNFWINWPRRIPPPRRHRHHYHGVLALNSPLRSKITSDALPIKNPVQNEDPPPPSNSPSQEPTKKDKSKASQYGWATLMARIFEILPLLCPKCNHSMKIISFIQDSPTIRRILNHINEPPDPPIITPAREPPEPEYNFDQTYEFA